MNAGYARMKSTESNKINEEMINKKKKGKEVEKRKELGTEQESHQEINSDMIFPSSLFLFLLPFAGLD